VSVTRRSGAAGFTLLEILVALAVLAIALTATMRGLGAAVDTTSALRDRTLARWVAEDLLAGLELRQEWPALDVKEGDAEMAGHAFHWRQETGPTPVAKMRRVELNVMLPGTDVAIVHLTGFVEQTVPQVALPPGSPTGTQAGSQTGTQAGTQTGTQPGSQPGSPTGPVK
jgi:general secretion pathway protein I